MVVNEWANGFLYHINDMDDKENIIDEVRSFTEVLKKSEGFAFLKDLSVHFNNKMNMLMGLRDDVDFRVLALIAALTKEGVIADIDDIIFEIQRGILREKGYTIVDITTSTHVDDEMEKKIIDFLHSMIGLNIKTYYHVDRSIVGGFIIEFDGKMIDISTRTRLSRLKQDVVGSVVKGAVRDDGGDRHTLRVYKSIDNRLTSFEDRIIEKKGKKVVRVISARPLDMNTKSFLKHRLEGFYNNEVFIRYAIDPSILGGIILQQDRDKMLDLSMRGKLDWFRNHIQEEVITLD